jgi:hypothetical protein
MFLAVYHCTPTNLFDKESKLLYGTAQTVMSRDRYFNILKSLSNLNGCGSVTGDGMWNPPMSPNIIIQELLTSIRKHCKDMAYDSQNSIISIDDDLVRLRSLKTEEAGFMRIKNPQKG